MTTRLKHYKSVALVGVTTAALGLFSLAARANLMPYLGIEILLPIIGAGVGTSFPLVRKNLVLNTIGKIGVLFTGAQTFERKYHNPAFLQLCPT
jgi:hypothetical protein